MSGDPSQTTSTEVQYFKHQLDGVRAINCELREALDDCITAIDGVAFPAKCSAEASFVSALSRLAEINKIARRALYNASLW